MTENVKHLDTVNFNNTISAYAKHIKDFESIVSEVNRSVNTILENWKGKGCNAFEKDSIQVQLNLKDISDIMYDLHESLINAHAEYIKADSALSKTFDS